MHRKSLTLIFLTTMVLSILSGCSSIQSTIGKEVDTAPLLDIVKGSPTEDLIALLGEPKSIQPHDKDPEYISIWIYEREQLKTDMVGVRTIDVPFVDPITGEMKMMKEPDYQPQTTKSTIIIQVFVAENQVLGWKVDREVNRDIVE